MNRTGTERNRPRRSGWRTLVMSVLVVTLLGAAAYAGWSKYLRPQDPLAGYQLVTVQTGSIEDVVTATGTLQPRDYVDVGAQVSGLLTRIHVDVGSEVSEGALLAEIDPRVLQSRVDATRAQLRNQRAQLMDRQASLKLAELQYQRQQNLMAEDATTEETLQSAEATLLSARAQIEALKAQIDQTDSNLRADEANLEYTRIHAPFAGTVVSITARQGQTLNANQQAPTILRVADLTSMTVQTQVSEADVGRLRPGMEAYFTTLGGTGQRWHGQLRSIEPTPVVTNNVVLYNALFDVANPDRRLMSQMTAQVFFVVAGAENTLTVPMAALSGLSGAARSAARGTPDSANRERSPSPAAGMRDESLQRTAANGAAMPRLRRATVRVVVDGNRIEEREVSIGVTSRIAAQILDGLSEGDQVVAGVRLPGAARNTQTSSPIGIPRR